MLKIIQNSRKLSEPISCLCFSTQKHPSSDENNTGNISSEVKKTELKPSEAPTKYNVKDVKPKDMLWRTPWYEKESQHFNTLRSFYTEDSQTNFLKLLHSPINLSPSAIKKWWNEKKEYKEIMMQSYLAQRNQILGNELAAAHFIVHRGGAIKFYMDDKWIKANEYNEYKLPNTFQEDKILQAIDCSNMNLYYEGLINLRELKQVEWLSFNGVEQFDDWCLDRVSNYFSHSLVYLDIRNCPKYTERGLGALYKLENLKILCIDDMLMTSSFEMTCLMLQEVNPNLNIQIGD